MVVSNGRRIEISRPLESLASNPSSLRQLQSPSQPNTQLSVEVVNSASSIYPPLNAHSAGAPPGSPPGITAASLDSPSHLATTLAEGPSAAEPGSETGRVPTNSDHRITTWPSRSIHSNDPCPSKSQEHLPSDSNTMTTNMRTEANVRYKKSGGKIWLVLSLISNICVLSLLGFVTWNYIHTKQNNVCTQVGPTSSEATHTTTLSRSSGVSVTGVQPQEMAFSKTSPTSTLTGVAGVLAFISGHDTVASRTTSHAIYSTSTTHWSSITSAVSKSSDARHLIIPRVTSDLGYPLHPPTDNSHTSAPTSHTSTLVSHTSRPTSRTRPPVAPSESVKLGADDFPPEFNSFAQRKVDVPLLFKSLIRLRPYLNIRVNTLHELAKGLGFPFARRFSTTRIGTSASDMEEGEDGVEMKVEPVMLSIFSGSYPQHPQTALSSVYPRQLYGHHKSPFLSPIVSLSTCAIQSSVTLDYINTIRSLRKGGFTPTASSTIAFPPTKVTETSVASQSDDQGPGHDSTAVPSPGTLCNMSVDYQWAKSSARRNQNIPPPFRMLVLLFINFDTGVLGQPSSTQFSSPSVNQMLVPTLDPRGNPFNNVKSAVNHITSAAASIGNQVAEAVDIKFQLSPYPDLPDLDLQKYVPTISKADLWIYHLKDDPRMDDKNATSAGYENSQTFVRSRALWWTIVICLSLAGSFVFAVSVIIAYYVTKFWHQFKTLLDHAEELKGIFDDVKNKVEGIKDDAKKQFEEAKQKGIDFFNDAKGDVMNISSTINNTLSEDLPRKIKELMKEIMEGGEAFKKIVSSVENWVKDTLSEPFKKIPGLGDIKWERNTGKRDLIDSRLYGKHILDGRTVLTLSDEIHTLGPEPMNVRATPISLLDEVETTHITITNITTATLVKTIPNVTPMDSAAFEASLLSGMAASHIVSNTKTWSASALVSGAATLPMPSNFQDSITPFSQTDISSLSANAATSSIFSSGVGRLVAFPFLLWLFKGYKVQGQRHTPRQEHSSLSYWQTYSELRGVTYSLCQTVDAYADLGHCSAPDNEFATLTCKSLLCDSLDKTYSVAISEEDCDVRTRYEALMGAAKSYCDESLRMVEDKTFYDKTQMIAIARCPFCDIVHSPASGLELSNIGCSNIGGTSAFSGSSGVDNPMSTSVSSLSVSQTLSTLVLTSSVQVQPPPSNSPLSSIRWC
jgi:hypothetical protein